MDETQQYIVEHRDTVWKFCKHIVPYITVILGALVFLTNGGWLDAPARSSIVNGIIVDVGVIKNHIHSLQEAIKKTSVNNAVTAQKLLSIDQRMGSADTRLKSIDSKLDRIIERMIQRSE